MKTYFSNMTRVRFYKSRKHASEASLRWSDDEHAEKIMKSYKTDDIARPLDLTIRERDQAFELIVGRKDGDGMILGVFHYGM